MPVTDYADFDLEITRLAKGRYQARVIDSPAGEAAADFKRPFSALELENFVLKIGRTRSGTRSLNSPEMQAAETFGKRLFEAIFQGGVRECLTSSLHQVDRDEIPGLRLRLRLVGVPELADIPWEYLYHTSLRRFIVLSTQTPIVRYTDLPRPVQPMAVAAPLRLLMMVSNPPDYKPLDVAQEKAKIEAALQSLEGRGLIEVEWLEKATLSALQQRLRKAPVHLFHFIGHGGYDQKAQDGVLVFEDDQGRGRPVGASHLATILRDHKSLRLVVLNACEGGRASPKDPFAGVAGALIQQGMPAVLAMQFEITDGAAIELAQVFYDSLADGYSAEAALAEARKAIFASGNDVEWGTPVLYLRAPEGRLFDLRAQAEPVASIEPEKPRIETREVERAAEKEPAQGQAGAAPVGVIGERADKQPAEQAVEVVQPPAQPVSTRMGFRAITPESVQQLEQIRVFAGHTKAVKSVAFSPDGSMLASGSSDQTISLCRVADGAELYKFNVIGSSSVTGVAFSPDGTQLASASLDKTVRLWQLSDWKAVQRLQVSDYHVTSVAFSPDGNWLAAGTWGTDKRLWIWRLTGERLLHNPKGHKNYVESVAFSPDGNLLASASWDHSVRLWRVTDGAQVATLEEHSGSALCVDFSPNREVLASGSGDKTIILWRVRDGAIVAKLKGHTSTIDCLAFSPDGSLLASGSSDQTIRLWHVQDGVPLHTLTGHTKQVNSVAFSPDGTLLASGSGGVRAGDNTIRLWGIPGV